MFKPSIAAEADADAIGNYQQPAPAAAPRTSDSVRRNWLAISTSGWQDWPRIAPAWHGLAESSDASFFLSATWVTTWMERFGHALKPDILTFSDGFGDPVGFCVLVKKTVWRALIPMRTIFLNCAGEDVADETCSEYNHLLARPGAEQSVMDALAAYLQHARYDSLQMNGATEQMAALALSGRLGASEVKKQPSHYVDLAGLREAGKRYDQTLSSNMRTQIRRSLKIYAEQYGPLVISEPSSAEAALSYLHELAGLHQASWTKRGKPGVFSSPVFRLFHESLVRRTFPLRQVQLLKVTAGAKVLGVLYNFIYKGRVYFYQSGLSYSEDNRLKPGLVTHFMAVDHCLKNASLLEYDFLAGDSQYKNSLGTNHRDLTWLTIGRNTPVTWALHQLRSLRRRAGQSR